MSGTAAADRNRVGHFVRRALPRELARRGCDWPCTVEWDDRAVRAYLTRGELVVSDFHRRLEWWIPVDRGNGERITAELASVLYRWWRRFRDADETGRRYMVRWRDASGVLHEATQPTGGAVIVQLEPGVYLGDPAALGLSLVYRHGEPMGMTMEEAIVLGWVRVED